MKIQYDTVYRPQKDKVGRVPEWCIQLIRNRLEARYKTSAALKAFVFETINARLTANPKKRLGTIFQRDFHGVPEIKSHICSLIDFARLHEDCRLIVPSEPFKRYYRAQNIVNRREWNEAEARAYFAENTGLPKPVFTDTTSIVFQCDDLGHIKHPLPENYALFDTESEQPFQYLHDYSDKLTKFCLIEWLRWSEPDV